MKNPGFFIEEKRSDERCDISGAFAVYMQVSRKKLGKPVLVETLLIWLTGLNGLLHKNLKKY